LRVWFSREELENRLEILPLEAVFDRECTLQALAEMETSDDPKIADLLRDWNDAENQDQYSKMLDISEQLISIRCLGIDWLKKAESYRRLGKKNEAIQALNKAIEIEPNNAEIWRLRGSELYDLGLAFDVDLLAESLLSYKKSIQLNNKDSLTWGFKAFLEARIGNKKEALNSIKNAIQLDASSIDVMESAYFVYHENEDKQKSCYYMKKLLEIDSDNDIDWRNKALLFMNDNNKVALKCAQKAVELNPNSSKNHKVISMIKYLVGDYKQALTSIDNCIKLSDFDS
jgi:tetratricopeptide (TPR) repeat protein